MAHNNAKAFEYTKEITVAAISGKNFSPGKDEGIIVAGFFEAVFNKLVELEDNAKILKDD